MTSKPKLSDQTSYQHRESRRDFTKFILSSPLWGAAAMSMTGRARAEEALGAVSVDDMTNTLQFEDVAREKLTEELYHFVADGADDGNTVRANRAAFDDVQIRARRLVDISGLDMSTTILGQTMETPILLAPVGGQGQLNAEGELATGRAAAARKHVMLVSTVSTYSINDVAQAGGGTVWFQLYPSTDRDQTKQLLARAEAAGANVVAVTIDGPGLGNRERENLERRRAGGRRGGQIGNYEGIATRPLIGDPTLTWDYVDWLKKNTDMKVLLKGIVTHEDARLCVENGADGLIVSNHGGRQEESNRGTFECLPEIVEEVGGKLPVLIDGGIRRGTDIFKALATGADAICIGRPYIWGLSAFGEDGVAKVLDILRAELARIMQFAGTPTLGDIKSSSLMRRN